MLHVLPFVSTLVTFAFAAVVLLRFVRKGGMHLLMWGIGLVLYGLGTLAEAWLFFDYHPFLLKLWYLTGAILTAAWLGQGTIFLLVRRRGVAPVLTVLLALLSLFVAYWVFNLPLTGAAYDLARPVSAQYGAVLVRDTVTRGVMLPIFTGYGTLALVGGALYSAYIFWRKRVLPNRVIGNVLIALGALSPALGGVLVTHGLADVLFVSELLGAIVMFVGFLAATSALMIVQESRPVPVRVVE